MIRHLGVALALLAPLATHASWDGVGVTCNDAECIVTPSKNLLCGNVLTKGCVMSLERDKNGLPTLIGSGGAPANAACNPLTELCGFPGWREEPISIMPGTTLTTPGVSCTRDETMVIKNGVAVGCIGTAPPVPSQLGSTTTDVPSTHLSCPSGQTIGLTVTDQTIAAVCKPVTVIYYTLKCVSEPQLKCTLEPK